MKIIIVGCGRLGVRLATILQMRGHQITVIDNDPTTFEKLGPTFTGKKIIGVGFDRDILIRAGIEKADGLAAVTSSDEANVVAARLAKQFFKVPRVTARVYDPRKAEIYRRFGIQTISPVAIGASRLAELLSTSPYKVVFNVGGGEVDIVELELPTSLEGRGIRDLAIVGEVQVVAITRTGKTFLPNEGTAFMQGDVVHLAITSPGGDRLKPLLGLA